MNHTKHLAWMLTLLICGAPGATFAKQLPIDGWWLSVGYGYFLEIDGGSIALFELTAISCLPSASELSIEAADSDGSWTLNMEGDPVGGSLILDSESEMRLQPAWAASAVVFRRVPSRPELCKQSVENTPQSNFDVFWTTYKEHYPLFDLKGMDWAGVGQAVRSRITDATTAEELFEHFVGMISPLQDAHTGIIVSEPEQVFRGMRQNPGLDPALTGAEVRSLMEKRFDEALHIIESQYLLTSRRCCKKHIMYGKLPGGLMYLRVDQESDYTDREGFAAQMSTLEAFLNIIFSQSRNAKGLILDVRKNYGGSDLLSLALASRLTDREYYAFSKVARSDPDDPTVRTPGQVSMVKVSDWPGFTGPVVQLIGPYTISAGETLTQALMGRRPKITRVGEATQGVFSDTLGRQLPNGWKFWLPNELFLTEDGEYFDGPGIQPDVHVPVFHPDDIEAGRDPALEKAIELLQEPQ